MSSTVCLLKPSSPERAQELLNSCLHQQDDGKNQGARGRNMNKPDKLMKFDKGTTTLAFKFKGGIMVACDSRASQGSFVASQTVRKVIEINQHLLGTMAGGAADCSFWERYLAKLCRIHELRHGQRITVAHASKLLANIFWEYRGYGLSCGTMIAGYDEGLKDASLYYVSDEGSRILGNLFSVGSGSTYAYGVLDTYYKYDMSVEEAQELAKRAIYHAGHRDGGSGGVVRVYHIHENGWTKLIEADDFFDMYKQYAGSFELGRQSGDMQSMAQGQQA